MNAVAVLRDGGFGLATCLTGAAPDQFGLAGLDKGEEDKKTAQWMLSRLKTAVLSLHLRRQLSRHDEWHDIQPETAASGSARSWSNTHSVIGMGSGVTCVPGT